MPKGIPGSGKDDLQKLLDEKKRIAEELQSLDTTQAKLDREIAAVQEAREREENLLLGAAVRFLLDDHSIQRRLVQIAPKVVELEKTKTAQTKAQAAFKRVLGVTPQLVKTDDPPISRNPAERKKPAVNDEMDAA